MTDESTIRLIQQSQASVLNEVRKMMAGAAMRPATVVPTEEGQQQSNRLVDVLVDGEAESGYLGDDETATVPMVNLTSSALVPGQRVMVQYVQPHGGFIVAKIPPLRIPAFKLVSGPDLATLSDNFVLGAATDAEDATAFNVDSTLITPVIPGKYLVSASMGAASSGITGYIAQAIHKNDNTLEPEVYANTPIEAGWSLEVALPSVVVNLEPGDYISHWGSTQHVNIAIHSYRLSMVWLGDVVLALDDTEIE